MLLAAFLALVPQMESQPLTPQQRVDRASPGDTVVVELSRTPWPNLRIDKPLTLVGGWFEFVQIYTAGRVTLRGTSVTRPSFGGGGTYPAVSHSSYPNPARLVLDGCYITAGSGTGVVSSWPVVVRDSHITGHAPSAPEGACGVDHLGWYSAVISQSWVLADSSYLEAISPEYPLSVADFCLNQAPCNFTRSKACPAVSCQSLLYSPNSLLIGGQPICWSGFGECPVSEGVPYEVSGWAVEADSSIRRR